MPTHEDFARNSHGPLIITRNPLAPQQVGVNGERCPAVILLLLRPHAASSRCFRAPLKGWNTFCLQEMAGCSSPADGVSFNHRQLVPFDTPLFSGGFAMMVAGLPSTPAGEPPGKRCFQHIVFQVRQCC
jgi:hypothetical protein